MSSDSLDVSEFAALTQLFEEFRPRLLAMLRRRIDPALAQRVDAEDVLADAYLVARNRWKQYAKSRKVTPYAWLYRIALDQLFETRRRETRLKRDLQLDMPWPEHSSIQLGLNLIDLGTSPTEAARRKELRERVRQMMMLLSQNDQDILWMRHHDQLSFKEAAAVLEITQNAANVRYARALRRLREIWETLQNEA